MASELPTAVLTVARLDGSKRTWRVKLTPRTPFEHDALLAALFERFVDDPDLKATDFTLTIGGTAGSPAFTLEEREDFFGEAKEIT